MGEGIELKRGCRDEWFACKSFMDQKEMPVPMESRRMVSMKMPKKESFGDVEEQNEVFVGGA